MSARVGMPWMPRRSHAPQQDALVVTQVEPNHGLVWRVLNPSTHEPAGATWAFVIRPIHATHTRLT